MTSEALASSIPHGAEPAARPPFVAAMKILVADKARCLAHLSGAGIAFHETKRGCLVPPSEANGAILELVEG